MRIQSRSSRSCETRRREPDGGGLPQARDQRRDVLQVEVEVWRHGLLGRQTPEGA